jgi:hypothetical protein
VGQAEEVCESAIGLCIRLVACLDLYNHEYVLINHINERRTASRHSGSLALALSNVESLTSGW